MIAAIALGCILRCDLRRDAAHISSPREIVARDLLEVATLSLGHIIEKDADATLIRTDVGAVIGQLDGTTLFGESKDKR